MYAGPIIGGEAARAVANMRCEPRLQPYYDRCLGNVFELHNNNAIIMQ